MTGARLLLTGCVIALAGMVLMATGCGDAPAPSTAVAADPACAQAPDACVTVGIGEPIYLGTLLYPSDDGGVVTARSVQLAVDYLDGRFDGHSGTLRGHAVDVIPEAEDCTPASGRAGARRLLAAAPVLGVIGTTCSAAAYRAAAEVLSRHRVLLISPTNTSPLLTSPQGHDRYFFRTAFNDLIQAAAVAEFAGQRLRARTAATVSVNEAYSRPLAAQFVDGFGAEGGRAVAALTVTDPLGAGRAAQVASRLANAAPGVIFLPLMEPACGTMVRAIRAEAALATTPVVVSEACMSATFLRRMGSLANGIYASGPDPAGAGSSSFATVQFLPAYRRQFGSAPATVFAFAAFDATNLVLEAVRRTAVQLPGGALVINREALRASIISVNGYDGLSGILTCLPAGDCVPAARISVYRAPQWPVGGRTAALPVFSTARTLAEVTGGG